MYLSVYGVLGLLQAIFIMLSAIILSVGTLNAASKLHGTMLERILRSPMSFFDTTPLGRILNRFSKDIDIVDVSIRLTMKKRCPKRGILGHAAHDSPRTREQSVISFGDDYRHLLCQSIFHSCNSASLHFVLHPAKILHRNCSSGTWVVNIKAMKS